MALTQMVSGKRQCKNEGGASECNLNPNAMQSECISSPQSMLSSSPLSIDVSASGPHLSQGFSSSQSRFQLSAVKVSESRSQFSADRSVLCVFSVCNLLISFGALVTYDFFVSVGLILAVPLSAGKTHFTNPDPNQNIELCSVYRSLRQRPARLRPDGFPHKCLICPVSVWNCVNVVAASGPRL